MSLEIEFDWVIDQFSLLPQKMGESLQSPIFTDGHLNWKLGLYPKGKKEESKDHVSIYLEPDQEDISVKFKILFLNKQKQVLADNKDWVSVWFRNSEKGFSKFVKVDDLLRNESKNIMPADELHYLHIKCWVKYVAKRSSTVGYVHQLAPITSSLSGVGSLPFSFQQLFTEKSLCDIVIKVEERTFEAHKFVLSV